MRTVVLSRLRLQWTRYLMVLAVVAVSSGFMTAALGLSSTLTASMTNDLVAQYKNADAVVTSQADDAFSFSATPQQVEELSRVTGVESVWAQYTTGAIPGSNAVSSDGSATVTSNLPDDPALFPAQITQGEYPSGDDQALLDESLAEKLEVGVGDTVSLQDMSGALAGEGEATEQGAGAPSAAKEFTVSGLTETSATGAFASVWLSNGALTRLSPDQISGGSPLQAIQLALDGSVSDARLQELTTTAGQILAGGQGQQPELRVVTPEQLTEEMLDQLAAGSNILTVFLLAFAGLSILVALLVVTNTLSVLTAQRARELALLRCVGATSKQVRRSVLTEGLVLGIVGASIGVAVVWALAVALQASGIISALTVTVAPRDLLVGFLTGIVLTMVASLGPARRAHGASPLDGLRGSRAADGVPRVRIVLGALILVAGAGTLVFGASERNPILGIVGGLASFLGVVMTSRLYLPPLVQGLGRLLPGGQPSRLAAVNAARYPARTATTATALLIGVLLVATVLTGQHVARVNLLNELDQNRPVDISVPASAGQVSLEQVQQISELNGVLGVKTTDPADADGAIAQIDAAQSLNNSSAAELQEKVAEILNLTAGELQGALMEKASYVSILDVMLTVTLGLLAAAVVVSVLGIASTMSLSVLERVRENSLLRALGLTRRQLGAMIRREALVISLVATIVGLVVGWAFGTLGVMSLVTEGMTVEPTVPWAGFLAIIVAAVVVAVLASAAPVRRATRVSPVEGMARVD
ncbi:FtsX-like permease family protein [Kocuria sp. cx-455]|uniref:FtsX-like permease family protein n=1 Tax=Kocuria sp. cx-455 TaxID=2771377 RepID=UPI001683AFEB|nr:FtsX-like permease family protein [Kocuria sp. cx-455]MBD2765764.1 FtsX-like permease family protein [Kocuria sp. cx-455]